MLYSPIPPIPQSHPPGQIDDLVTEWVSLLVERDKLLHEQVNKVKSYFELVQGYNTLA